MLITPRQLSCLSLPRGVKLVSFDVFDTLILRSIDPPQAVTKLVAQRIIQTGVLPLDVDQYLDLRATVERELRVAAQDRGDDPECSITEIAASVAGRLGLFAEVQAVMVQAELDVESRLLMPAPGVRDFLKRLSGTYRLVAVSDTDLDSNQIAGLLRQAGLESFFSCIYTSCEQRLNKRGGRLFTAMLAQEGVSPWEMLHLGDNFHTDYLAPRRHGIHALHLYDSENLLRRSLLRHQGHQPYNFFFGGHPPETGLTGETFELHRVGYQLFGPLLTLFSVRLQREMENYLPQTLFFLARDGYLLKKLAALQCPEKVRGAGYLALSRFTAALASVHRLGEREVRLFGFACHSLRDALRRLALAEHDALPELLGRLGLELDAPLPQEELYRALARLFALPDLAALVLPVAAEMRKILRSYLDENGFFGAGRRVAVVDIGWHGTIQECLETAYGMEPDFPELRGFYFALMAPVFDSDADRRGLISDYRQAAPEQTSLALYQAVWELVCRGYHGSTVGYREHAGYHLPIWAQEGLDRGRQLRLNHNVLALQQGVLACARDFGRRSLLQHADLELLLGEALGRFEADISFPERRLVALLEHCFHSDDFGADRSRIFIPRFSWGNLMRPRQLLTQFLAAPWREATLVRSGVPCLTLYYLIKRVVCWKKSVEYHRP